MITACPEQVGYCLIYNAISGLNRYSQQKASLSGDLGGLKSLQQ